MRERTEPPLDAELARRLAWMREHDVPGADDPALVECVADLEPVAELPTAAYRSVAELLDFLHDCARARADASRRRSPSP